MHRLAGWVLFSQSAVELALLPSKAEDLGGAAQAHSGQLTLPIYLVNVKLWLNKLLTA